MVGPSLTVGLEPLAVPEGEAATFTVEFVGSPSPEVKWYRYTFPVKDSKDFKIVTTETTSTLTILRTCADDAGVFTCLLENIVGAAKTSSNLVVKETSREYVSEATTSSTHTMEEMAVSEGDNIRFDIGFSGGDRNNLEFTLDGRTLEEKSGISISVENEVASLLIEKAGPEHSGLYECIMRTEGGEARCQVRCRVTPVSPQR
jgi:hypothetical protein